MQRATRPVSDLAFTRPQPDAAPLPTADLLHSCGTGQKPIEFCDLERLLELSRFKSYTEAAFRMKITESHLRRKIRQLEDTAGFQLIKKNNDRSLALTGQARSWLSSFAEFHQSLIQLDEAINTVQQLNADLKIGIEPCLMFSSALWERLDLQRNDDTRGNTVFRVGDFPRQKNVDDCDVYISTRPLPGSLYESHLLYMERIFYYQSRTNSLNDTNRHISVLSSPPITRDRARAMLCGSRKFQDCRFSYARSECATDSLQRIRRSKEVFLSFKLNQEIVPAEVIYTPLAEHSCIPVYLTSLREQCHPSLLDILSREPQG